VVVFTTDYCIAPVGEEHAEVHHRQAHHSLENHSRHGNWEECCDLLLLGLFAVFGFLSDEVTTNRLDLFSVL